MDYNAPYDLVNDNLLDLSHVSFVHERSLQLGTAFSDREPRISTLPRGVRIERWLPAAQPAAALRTPDSVPIDTWWEYDYLIPGIFIQRTAMFAEGVADVSRIERPDFEKAHAVHYAVHAATPMTATTCRYFYYAGPRADQGSSAEAELIIDRIAQEAFKEDRAMIEAQFQVMQSIGPRRRLGIRADRAITLFDGMMRRLSKAPESLAQQTIGEQ
jgi:vanillate O-demethylase monooxygenase subunit